MRLLRRVARLARLLLHLARGVWLAATRMPRDPPPRTEAQWRLVRWWHRRALELLGVEARIHGRPLDGPVLFVANHVSWLDISALLTITDAGFIGKRELRDWPVIGLLIRRGGTIFIDRGGPGAAAGAATEMIRRLRRRERVAVFPEGTTTRGDHLRRFHPRLFDAALQTGSPVQPIALRYDHPAAAFVDDEPFLGSLWRVLGEPCLRVDVTVLPPIPPAGLDRRQLAQRAQAAIAERIGIPREPTREAATDGDKAAS